MPFRPLTLEERKIVEGKILKAKEDKALSERYIVNLEDQLKNGHWTMDPVEEERVSKEVEAEAKEHGPMPTFKEQFKSYHKWIKDGCPDPVIDYHPLLMPKVVSTNAPKAKRS